jgi:hypothetical protein
VLELSLHDFKQKLIAAFSFLTVLLAFENAGAQGNLTKLVYIGPVKRITIAALLEKISDKQNFSFAYNNNAIPADSLVEVSGYRGTVFSLLEKLLGDNYEYKEVPGYVVLRNAPGRLSMSAEIDMEPGMLTLIKGYVNNVADQKALSKVSVFEVNLLVSTITDERGYFELRVKNWNGPVLLTARKENFRDTSLHMLSGVVVTGKSRTQKYSYYPNQGSDGVEHNRFARFFIGSKQLIQSLNIGNFFASRPYQISVIPGLSSHGLYNSQIVDHFSINLLGGYTAGINGFEAGGLFNINRGDVQYFQAAGIFNFVGGNARGVQFAGIYNRVLKSASGFQVAGLANNTTDFTSGVQLAGLINKSDRANGALQIAGIANVSKESNGISLAGLSNFAGTKSTVQVAGLMNNGGRQTNFQLSALLNLAGRVRGTQIGLINIADSSDYPFGIINWVKNGQKTLALETDETLFTQLNLRAGGRVMYSLLGIGYQFGKKERKYQLNFGLGAHIFDSGQFHLSTELTTNLITGFKKGVYQRNSLKVLPGFQLNKYLRFFAGPSITVSSPDAGVALPASGLILKKPIGPNGQVVSAGISGGLQYVW